jgi:hypothetical protein
MHFACHREHSVLSAEIPVGEYCTTKELLSMSRMKREQSLLVKCLVLVLNLALHVVLLTFKVSVPDNFTVLGS